MSQVPGTVTALARAVREGRISAAALTIASIDALERAAGLNVTAEKTYDAALERARRIDDGGPAGPLVGVPTLIKDLEDLEGSPTRQGSLARRDVSPAKQSSVVASRLVASGAVVVGKSTLPEFAIEGFTANLLTGVTRNPWNQDYSPGGSSGGSAAALASGLVGVATATDGGGSVRIPSALCGLVGLKPTNGVVGRWPAPDWIDYSTDGPLATSSDDLRLIFDVMRGPVAGDPSSPPMTFGSEWPQLRESPGRLIAAERTSPLGPLAKDVSRCFREAVQAVADLLGVAATWLEPEEFFRDGDPDLDWFTVTSAEHVASLGRDWVEAHMDEFHVATREFLTTGLNVGVDEYLSARRRRYHYVRALDVLLADNSLLLTPTVAAPGWLADGRTHVGADVHGLPPEVYSTAVQNVTGHPAISVPFGRLPVGLPFGLQITAGHYHDYRLLGIAAEVEEAYPWPRTAPGYEPLDVVLGLT